MSSTLWRVWSNGPQWQCEFVPIHFQSHTDVSKYCSRLYMSIRMWKQYYNLKAPPDFVQVKPTVGEEDILEQQGFLVKDGAQLQ
jgi:hypothetical protein